MRVTKAFGIRGTVPFLDVHIDKDNRLFLDPSAIRNGKDKYATAANTALISFFTEVLRLRQSKHAADHAKGRALLTQLHEPNETRLGMSVASKFGKAFGSDQSQGLWDLLGRSHEARIAVLTRLEHLRLFADGVGYDLISDASTRIVFHVLADFTAEMMRTYPSLAVKATSHEFDVFNPTSLEWEKRSLILPLADERPILLVPKGWVYWRTLMELTQFYNRYATETLQLEQAVRQQDGSLSKPSKKKIQAANKDMRDLNRKQATKYKENANRNLVEEYQHEVDAAFKPLTDAEILRRTEEH